MAFYLRKLKLGKYKKEDVEPIIVEKQGVKEGEASKI